MAEYTIRQVPYLVIRTCDDCGGVMEATGRAYMTSPPQYLHRCVNCGAKRVYGVRYPYTKMIPDSEDYIK